MTSWRTANDRVVALEISEAGAADGAAPTPVAPELQELRDRYLGDPMIKRSFALLPSDVEMVDLDKVVVFQKSVNLRYAHQIGLGLPRDSARVT